MSNNSILSQVEAQYQSWYGLLSPEDQQFLQQPGYADAAKWVLAGSEFVANLLLYNPSLFNKLKTDLFRSYNPNTMGSLLDSLLLTAKTELELHQILRKFRQEMMIRIIWRDIGNLATLEETLEDLSALADACIVRTVDFLSELQRQELGIPETYIGKSQQLIVLAMGKLGARELNLSSDIDLIFVD
ncbi:hypothetical protein TI04_12760 [Achromatium sp. WMS2]|nr:hypothetical protein TI04_12760 [Achromatium sp. WMS2]